MAVASAALRVVTKLQRKRRDYSAFAALITTPGNLNTGFALPANAEVLVSTSSVLAVTTVLLNANLNDFGAPASAANRIHSVGRIDKGVTVTKDAGAPGIVSLYIRSPAGAPVLIGGS